MTGKGRCIVEDETGRCLGVAVTREMCSMHYQRWIRRGSAGPVGKLVPPGPSHGTSKRYERGCRCSECRQRHNERTRRNRSERRLAGRLSHGTRSAYDAGCRCASCKAVRKIAYAVLEKGAMT